jgi:hypothetical protein
MNRVEGLKVGSGTYFVNTGLTNIEIGTSLFTTIEGSVLDQASAHAVEIQAGADNVNINNCYIGSSQPSSAVAVQIRADAGNGHAIGGNTIAYCGYGVVAEATTTDRVVGLSIAANTFNTVGTPLMLDSVDKCIITSNIDTGSPISGSWMTKGTYGPGAYTFDDNAWHTQPPALFHAASKYRFGNDTGIVGRNAGRAMVPSPSNVMTISKGFLDA